MKRSDDDTQEVVYIYIPKNSTAPHVTVGGTNIVKGSAIIGLADDTSGGGVWYEGNVYDAVNLKRYSERVRNAAGRAFRKSPYTAYTGSGFDARDFYRIGSVSQDYAIFLDDMNQHARAIEEWTSETAESIWKDNKDFLQTRAFDSGDWQKRRHRHPASRNHVRPRILQRRVSTVVAHG
jgi:hypothetical protein